ncbi:ABC transporter substrate-binding protein [Cardiobacteriales bacterium ML27]|uniref:ABC transporter substrate-binding protein n=2 Tax=Ostreibacterium oceani TaxID=2654998 RepID=A0A6N7ERC7_9GAMM|nr:ABC transporter substrate-binding protein [Ostreibacterium oceani]
MIGRWRILILCLLSFLLSVAALPQAQAQYSTQEKTQEKSSNPVRVASKIDTEGSLLGELILQTLVAGDVPVEDKLSLGATNIVRNALLNNEIDLYPEYTGNGAFFSQTTEDTVWKSLEAGYEQISAWDYDNNKLVWLQPAPANNTWAIAVTRELAEKESLATLADLASYVNRDGKIKLAASAEFVNSPVALPSFQKVYGFTFNDGQLLVLSGGNTSATIRAAAEGINQANAAMVYGTDGAISAANLVVLDDIQGAQAVYAPAPVLREEILADYPQIPELLAPVFKKLNREVLQGLNEKIQVQGMPAKQVAKTFLVSNQLLPKAEESKPDK